MNKQKLDYQAFTPTSNIFIFLYLNLSVFENIPFLN